jgi:hypothetical protein
MRKKLILLVILSTQMAGCAHDFWVSLRNNTEIVSYTPPGALVYFVGMVGEQATRNDYHHDTDEDKMKSQLGE